MGARAPVERAAGGDGIPIRGAGRRPTDFHIEAGLARLRAIAGGEGDGGAAGLARRGREQERALAPS